MNGTFSKALWPPRLWPHAVLHAIEGNAEQIIFVSIDFNGETRFDMRVLWITSILLEQIMLVVQGSIVLYNIHMIKLQLKANFQRTTFLTV